MSFPTNSLYSLTWGDYGSSLVSTVQSLRCHGDLVDCTLAAGGRSFPAHKIVLCAASTFLMELLKNTPCKHPVVMLAGVNANDLESLLEFVYRGEVSVDHVQLPSLLQAAHCLKIQGLAPQTLTRDDYSTQIQLHPTMMSQNVKAVIDVGNGNMVEAFEQNDEMMTIEEPQQHIHAHVVEEILPHELTEVVTTDVKDVISQYLPNRKRKPRVKKQGNAKVARTENLQQIQQNQQQQTVQVQHVQQVQHIQQQQPQQHQVILQQQSPTTTMANSQGQNVFISNVMNGEEGTSQMIAPKPKSAVRRKAPSGSNAAVKAEQQQQSGDPDDPNNKEPKTRSQSEQPASCPICGAVIRQSRNLRRHLELRHFSKPGVKKERKSGPKASKAAAAGNASNIRTVNVKKEPEDLPSTSSGNTSQTIQLSVEPNNQHTLVDGSETQHIVTQHENTDGTTSLSIAQVQTLQGHQLSLGNMNATIQLRNDDQLESNLITTHEPTLRPHTELFRVGTVYTLEERRLDNNKLS